MEGLSVGEIVALISLPFLITGTIATISGLAHRRLRNLLFAGLLVFTFLVSGFVTWSRFWRDSPHAPVGPRPGPVARATPSPTPTPQRRKETPERQPTPAPEETDAAPGVPLYASSLDDASASAAYCVVGEIVGESRDAQKAIDIIVSRANLRLCNYSSHGPRRVAVKIGIASVSPAGGRKPPKIMWGPSVTLAERLNPGEEFSIPRPINISIPKRGRVNLTNARFVVQLSNVPYDSNREMRYYLSEGGQEQLARLGQD